MQTGESSPRIFLGRIFLFSTGRALKEPGLEEEEEMTWTERGPVIDKKTNRQCSPTFEHLLVSSSVQRPVLRGSLMLGCPPSPQSFLS